MLEDGTIIMAKAHMKDISDMSEYKEVLQADDESQAENDLSAYKGYFDYSGIDFSKLNLISETTAVEQKNNESYEVLQFLQENEYVYGVHGSVVILRKECIDKFLEDSIQIFMYGEELYIAEKLKENQFLSYYDKNLKIIHNENQSTGKIASQRKQKWCSQSINFLVERYWK